MTLSLNARTPSASVHALSGSSAPGNAATVQPFAIPTAAAGDVLEMLNPFTSLGDAAASVVAGLAARRSPHPDADVIDIAERVKALARRDYRIWDRRAAIEDAASTAFPLSALPPRPERPSRMTCNEVVANGVRTLTFTEPATPEPDYVAAVAGYENAKAERIRGKEDLEVRLGYPRWEKLSGRTFRRLGPISIGTGATR